MDKLSGGQPQGQQEKQKKEMEEAKAVMMAQILQQGARERLNKVRLVRPKVAEMMEGNLLRMAQTGQLKSKVTEKQLQDMLEKVSNSRQETTVTFKRSSLDDDW